MQEKIIEFYLKCRWLLFFFARSVVAAQKHKERERNIPVRWNVCAVGLTANRCVNMSLHIINTINDIC